MGINTGYCTVGNFGSEERMDYTIVGSDVNLAHRLEPLADTDQILISQSTYQLVKEDIVCKSREAILVKGFSEPVHTYQVLGTVASLSQQAHALNQKLDGFTLDMDTALLDGANKNKVREFP